jgi:Flp pilus assembly protein TadD
MRDGAERPLPLPSQALTHCHGSGGRGVFALAVVLAVLTVLVGCSAISTYRLPVDDVTSLKETRRQEAVRQFEERRDAAEYRAAKSAWERGDRAMCRESLDTLLARNPGHLDSRLLAADLCVAEGDPQAALEQLQQALTAHPNDPGVHQAMGALMDKLGRPENAWSHYQQAATLAQGGKVTAASYTSTSQNPNDPSIPTAAAIAALADNRPEDAIRLAEEARGRFGDHVPLLRVLGASYYRLGDYASSQRVLQQALSLDNSDPLAYFLQGCTLAKLGDRDAAEAHWRYARQLGSDLGAAGTP